jgi:hypothetical protein
LEHLGNSDIGQYLSGHRWEVTLDLSEPRGNSPVVLKSLADIVAYAREELEDYQDRTQQISITLDEYQQFLKTMLRFAQQKDGLWLFASREPNGKRRKRFFHKSKDKALQARLKAFYKHKGEIRFGTLLNTIGFLGHRLARVLKTPSPEQQRVRYKFDKWIELREKPFDPDYSDTDDEMKSFVKFTAKEDAEAEEEESERLRAEVATGAVTTGVDDTALFDHLDTLVFAAQAAEISRKEREQEYFQRHREYFLALPVEDEYVATDDIPLELSSEDAGSVAPTDGQLVLIPIDDIPLSLSGEDDGVAAMEIDDEEGSELDARMSVEEDMLRHLAVTKHRRVVVAKAVSGRFAGWAKTKEELIELLIAKMIAKEVAPSEWRSMYKTV